MNNSLVHHEEISSKSFIIHFIYFYFEKSLKSKQSIFLIAFSEYKVHTNLSARAAMIEGSLSFIT